MRNFQSIRNISYVLNERVRYGAFSEAKEGPCDRVHVTQFEVVSLRSEFDY